jgi:DNA polymerase III subunit gamma/tau
VATAALAKPAPPAASYAPRAPAPTPVVREPTPPAWLDDVPLQIEEAAPRSASAAPAAAAVFAPTPLGERWVALVAMLNERQSIAALVRELAMQAQLVEQHDGAQPQWRLRVERESLRAAGLVDKLRGALVQALGIDTLQLDVEAGAVTDSPARREAAERERRQREAETIIRNDPLVQELLAQFPSARIVPGSIKPH